MAEAVTGDPIRDHADTILAVLQIKDGIKWAERRGDEIRYITTDDLLVAVRFQLLPRDNLISAHAKSPPELSDVRGAFLCRA